MRIAPRLSLNQGRLERERRDSISEIIRLMLRRGSRNNSAIRITRRPRLRHRIEKKRKRKKKMIRIKVIHPK